MLSASIGLLNEVLQEELDGQATELVCDWTVAPLEVGGSRIGIFGGFTLEVRDVTRG